LRGDIPFGKEIEDEKGGDSPRKSIKTEDVRGVADEEYQEIQKGDPTEVCKKRDAL